MILASQILKSVICASCAILARVSPKMVTIALVALPVFADTNTIQLLTIGDRTFTNATIRKAGPFTVIVRDAGGFGSVAITNLPEPFKSQFLDPREIESERAAIRARKEREVEQSKAIYEAQKKALAVEIDGVLCARRSLKSIHVLVDRIEGNTVHGQFVELKPFYAPRRLTANQRAGAYIGYTPGPSGYDRDYKQEISLRHAPKDSSIGKEIDADAKLIGVVNGVETWDCGTVPAK